MGRIPKINIFLLLFFLIIPYRNYAVHIAVKDSLTDTCSRIVLTNNDTLKVKILQIKRNSVEYKICGKNRPVYEKSFFGIKTIIFADGKKINTFEKGRKKLKILAAFTVAAFLSGIFVIIYYIRHYFVHYTFSYFFLYIAKGSALIPLIAALLPSTAFLDITLKYRRNNEWLAIIMYSAVILLILIYAGLLMAV